MTTVLFASPLQLVEMADAVLRAHGSAWGGAWARAVALLARQALEGALDELWIVRDVNLSPVSAHAQILCLGAYLDDDALAAEVRYAWGALSRACHHHPYELAPTAEELGRWVLTVRTLIQRIHASPDNR
jgi:hypothetical protein